jgi:hypothetical protein
VKRSTCVNRGMLKPEERRSKQFEADLLTALRDLAASLHSLREQESNKQTDSTKKHEPAPKSKGYTVTPNIRSVVELPPEFTRNYTASQKQESRYQKAQMGTAPRLRWSSGGPAEAGGSDALEALITDLRFGCRLSPDGELSTASVASLHQLSDGVVPNARRACAPGPVRHRHMGSITTRAPPRLCFV